MGRETVDWGADGETAASVLWSGQALLKRRHWSKDLEEVRGESCGCGGGRGRDGSDRSSHKEVRVAGTQK